MKHIFYSFPFTNPLPGPKDIDNISLYMVNMAYKIVKSDSPGGRWVVNKIKKAVRRAHVLFSLPTRQLRKEPNLIIKREVKKCSHSISWKTAILL
jgi:hypothetical protein